MFEKFSVLDVDSAGRGGEYTVQVCNASELGYKVLNLYRQDLVGPMALSCGLRKRTETSSMILIARACWLLVKVRIVPHLGVTMPCHSLELLWQ